MSKVGIIEYEKLVNGNELMYDNKNLTSVRCPFPKLQKGGAMFEKCSNLNTFDVGDLSNLISSSGMFQNCSNLNIFNVTDLSKLEIGNKMFYIGNENGENTFTTFSVNLPMLKEANYMFARTKSPFEVVGDDEFNYPALETFEGDLSKLVDAEKMFFNSSIKYFLPTSNLYDLKNGHDMFLYAYLKPESFEKLSEVLPDITSLMTETNIENDDLWTYEVVGRSETIPLNKRGQLGLQCRSLDDEDLLAVQKYFDAITDKGWLVERTRTYLVYGKQTAEYNIPFYYSTSLNIEIQKLIVDSNGSRYESKVKGQINFNIKRDQGSSVQFEPVYAFEINELPWNTLYKQIGTFEPKDWTSDEEICLDDGTSTGDIRLQFDFLGNYIHGISLDFKLSSVKSVLSVTLNEVTTGGSEKYKVFIDDEEKFSN